MTLTDALNVLTLMASSMTLCYSLNLISCGQVITRKCKVDKVDAEDLRRACMYFMDKKWSVQWLREQQGSLVFEETSEGENGDAAMGEAMKT